MPIIGYLFENTVPELTFYATPDRSNVFLMTYTYTSSIGYGGLIKNFHKYKCHVWIPKNMARFDIKAYEVGDISKPTCLVGFCYGQPMTLKEFEKSSNFKDEFYIVYDSAKQYSCKDFPNSYYTTSVKELQVMIETVLNNLDLYPYNSDIMF